MTGEGLEFCLNDVLRRQNGSDARHCARLRHINAADGCVSERGADNNKMSLIGKRKIVDV